MGMCTSGKGKKKVKEEEVEINLKDSNGGVVRSESMKETSNLRKYKIERLRQKGLKLEHPSTARDNRRMVVPDLAQEALSCPKGNEQELLNKFKFCFDERTGEVVGFQSMHQ